MSKKPKEKMQKVALGVTRWIGSPQSIFLHTAVFVMGMVIVSLQIFSFNAVLLVFNTMVSLEAIYLALFIQMTVNYTSASIEEVEQDIDEIQEDIDEIQEDVDEIQEDVDEIQEDVEEMTEDEKEEEALHAGQTKTLEEIQIGLKKLIIDIERLQNK